MILHNLKMITIYSLIILILYWSFCWLECLLVILLVWM